MDGPEHHRIAAQTTGDLEGGNASVLALFDGTAIGGFGSVVATGLGSCSRTGDHGTAAAGNKGQAHTSFWGVAASGAEGHSVAGTNGVAVAGDRGVAQAGVSGTAVTRWRGLSMGGEAALCVAGESGAVQGSHTSILAVAYWDAAAARQRLLVGYVGENGLEADVPYRVVVDDTGPRFEREMSPDVRE